MSLVNDKNDFEKTIAPGKFGFLLVKYFFIFFISSILIFEPLYNSLFDAIFRDFNFKPSYNILIKDK